MVIACCCCCLLLFHQCAQQCPSRDTALRKSPHMLARERQAIPRGFVLVLHSWTWSC